MPIDTVSKSTPEMPQNKRGCGGMVRTDGGLLQTSCSPWVTDWLAVKVTDQQRGKKHHRVSKCSVSGGAAGPAACPFSSLLHGGHPRETNFTTAPLGPFLSRQQNVASGEGFRSSSPVLCTGAQTCLEASSTEVGCSSLPACCPMVETAAEIFRGSEK